MSRGTGGLGSQGPGREAGERWGGGAEKLDKGREIRDLDPERRGPCGVCAGSSMITGTGSEPGRSFHICSGLFDRDRLFRYWRDRVAFLLHPVSRVRSLSSAAGTVSAETVGGGRMPGPLLSDSQDAHTNIPAEG